VTFWRSLAISNPIAYLMDKNLTAWSTDFLEKPAVKLVNKFLAFYGTPKVHYHHAGLYLKN
jgi:hypothetical protein